jgi:hypothetical protein
VVRNCQNLRKLRYAHNSLLHDAWIDWATCPNLTPENVDKHNWDGKLYGWNSCYDNQLDSDDKSTGNEKFIEKLQKQSDLTQQITTILTQGEANANLTQLLNLLEEIKLLQSAEPELYQSLNKEDLGKVIIFFNNHLETEVKSLITKYQTHQISLPSFKTQLEPFKNYLAALSPETIKQLQTILNSQTQSTTQLTPPQVKLWPWVVGGILATPLFLLLVYSLAKKIVTADLNKQTSPQDHKVR